MKPGPKPLVFTEEQEQFVRLSWGRVFQRRMAEMLGCSVNTVRRYAKRIGLPVLRRGRRKVSSQLTVAC
jgi:DNA-directed RNA polymerase specialized sigma24 family protein